MKLQFNINGLDELVRDIKALKKNAEAESGVEIKETATKIQSDAISNAPKDIGGLAASIVVEGEKNKYTIAVNAPYAPYVEFGTRTKFDDSIIKEWREEAEKFRDPTGVSRDEAILRISEWARRKGIEEDKISAVVFHILTYGIRSQPFFRPAVNANISGLNDRIDKKIQTFLDKV